MQGRKHLRIQLRGDLIFSAQRFEGRSGYVVHDPISLRYFRFHEQEYFILQRLDGAHTHTDIQREYEERFRPRRLALEEIEAFVQQIVHSGIAHDATDRSARRLLRRRRRYDRSVTMSGMANLLALQIPVFDPDKLLSRLTRGLGFLFTRTFLVVSGLVMVAALVLIGTQFETFRARMPDASEFFRFQTVGYLWLSLAVVKIIHEFGHGLACKKFGAHVHEMGILLLCFSPCLYCDVSDSWTLPSKWRRIAISLAGVYVEMLLAAIAAFTWWLAPGQHLIGHLCFSLILVCSVNTLFLNGNPLMRYDGYYALADWLEIPNLRLACNRLLKQFALVHLMGINVARAAEHSTARHLFLIGYAIVSFLYRWLVTASVLWLVYGFLKPFRLQAVAGAAACLTAVMFVCLPIYRAIRRLGKWPGRRLGLNPWRVATSLCILPALVWATFCVPLPVSRIQQVGLIQFQPDEETRVYAPSRGVLQRTHVRDGQWVERGDLLAEFGNPELENDRAEARSAHDIREMQITALREHASVGSDAAELARTGANLDRLLGDRKREAQLVRLLDRRKQELQLRAPRAGIVCNVPNSDAIGKTWPRESSTAFCRIGEPRRQWVLVPLESADHQLLLEAMQAARTENRELKVGIRIPGRWTRTWTGRVALLSDFELSKVPPMLTQRAGGPVGVKPGTSAALVQQYIVGIEINDADQAIRPGMHASVAIQCIQRPAIWWAWRFLARTFDLDVLVT